MFLISARKVQKTKNEAKISPTARNSSTSQDEQVTEKEKRNKEKKKLSALFKRPESVKTIIIEHFVKLPFGKKCHSLI